jgi:hypothetical protein
MLRKVKYCVLASIAGAFGLVDQSLAQPPASGTAWNAPERAAKVAELIPGRKIPNLTRETLFADWTKQQVDKWNKAHPSTLSPEEQYKQYAETAPSDAELLADFPRHIAPLARVRSGTPAFTGAAEGAFYSYCPLCQSQSFSLRYDPKNEYHATTVCCGAELFGREKDYPANYKLKPTEFVIFNHWGDTRVKIPCTVFTDKNGVVWELFIKTVFDQKRWLETGGKLVKKYGDEFKKTGNPLYAHKIAILLDAVADTYYGLPLCFHNEIKALSRAEWEASPRPSIFSTGPLGPWNRRVPNSGRGWLGTYDEHIWAEPFALVRHHPAFKQVSTIKYGNPETLDRKVSEKLIRELCLMFKSVLVSGLLTNYQEANYMNLILLGVLAQDKVLINFAAPGSELSLYNAHYHDGLNGEGSADYMHMPLNSLRFLGEANGWLRFQPDFLKANPFYGRGYEEHDRLRTVRGNLLEYADKHINAGLHNWVNDRDAKGKAQRELRGSRNWAAYGVGVLRVGGTGHRMETSITYLRPTLHVAQDALGIECWVDGVAVMRRGGYSAWWGNASLQWERPEFKALSAMDYPHKIFECSKDGGFASWSWLYAHILCQNTVLVDGTATGAGWSAKNRGYGEVVTFKGGEAAGEPGSQFQVLDVKDHYSWSQVKKPEVQEFRRTLIAVDTNGGRPYTLDLMKVRGGKEHALFNSAWAERGESRLPAIAAKVGNLEDALSGGYGRGTDKSLYKRLTGVEQLSPFDSSWELTWKTDYTAYCPRPADGKPFVRPLPGDDGKVQLRLIGLAGSKGKADLISAKGPWLATLNQPLPGGKAVSGVVAFEDTRDFLIERRRTGADGKELESLFIHVLEGFREGESTVIKSIQFIPCESIRGPARDIVTIKLSLVDGTTDTVLYQSEQGTVRLPDGTETDARYALIRRGADSKVKQVESCRASFVKGAGMDYKFPGDPTGEIVDIIGDLTGTRQESALILKTPAPWPDGDALKGRQLLVTFESTLRAPCAEGYRIDKVTNLPDGRVRVDLQDYAPFIDSWHDVVDLPPGKTGVLRTNRCPTKHDNSPWYRGMTVWFPEKQRTYTILKTSVLGGREDISNAFELAGAPDLAKDGIVPGDWFVVYGIRPGLKVNIPSEWRLNNATKINEKNGK